jgi:DNA-binding NarL/FixJ family response regulator
MPKKFQRSTFESPSVVPDSPEVQLLSQAEWTLVSERLKLSQRESEIAHVLLAGQSEQDAAVQLRISVHTVHSHVERLYRKLQVRSRCGLILRLFQTYISIRGSAPPPAQHSASQVS